MKFKLYPSSTIVVLLIGIVCLLGVIIFLFLKTREIKIYPVEKNGSAYSFSLLPPAIGKELNVGSRAFIIYDTSTRSVVGGKNDKFRFAPASTAKIMAATIILQNYDLSKVITANNLESLGSDNSKMGLVDGEQMSVENLLYGMMLPSGNDAAYALAQNFPGGTSGFVSAMNKKARELKLDNTYFFDPDGYDDQNYTTAYDLARLGAYAMQNPTFAKIVATKYKLVSDITGKFPHNLKNLNELLGVDGVNGIKTGFTDEAGGVLVTSINYNNKNYIVVVLGSKDRFLDTKSVIHDAVEKIHTLSY